ncbi:glycosyltransferase [Anaerosporobacter sp.]|uniref:glycosyltransferase n=1 Tax=Anaerosporobacter sp. TaxID=1872529 RepID=UPI00286F3DE2|nr:glycosyltransferase family 2 protein [Anaerosporobacter sp.]
MFQSISIIIPVKSKDQNTISQLGKYLCSLDNELVEKSIQYEIIIADECPCGLFEQLGQIIRLSEHIIHIIPQDRSGKNDKLNGIYSAFEYVNYEYCLIIDDHFRITAMEIIDIMPCFEEFDLFKIVPVFENYSIDVMIDHAGFFFRCITDKTKQFAGHIAMKSSLYKEYGFPDRDGLYDEYIVEKYYADKGAHIGFPKDRFFTATQKITLKNFFEQRVRYAYENIAFPIRFLIHLCLFPISLLLMKENVKLVTILFGLYCICIMLISLWGQFKFGKKQMPPVFLFAPIWHLTYWITSWMALCLFLTKGISFGGNRIHNPK